MRLITRGDLDGLTCAVIISGAEQIDDIHLVHPQDITDKRVDVTRNDILANLPFHPSCGMWFDHHLLTDSNARPPAEFKGRYGLAPSAARLVYAHYLESDPSLKRFETLVAETDRLDSANLTPKDVTDPKEYILLGYTIDGRTGLGDFRGYFKDLVRELQTKPIEEILELPEVRRRVQLIDEEREEFTRLLKSCSHMDGNVVVTDLRNTDHPAIGNRFLIYTLFPEANVQLRIHWGPQRQFAVAAVGHSIFNRTCATSVGELMSRYGGGGHRGAGTCIIPPDRAEVALGEILRELKENG